MFILAVAAAVCTTVDIDELLAKHIAHLFIRDPISLFTEKINQSDDLDSDHFENIQSTNWQTMRFKPPPPNTKIGWRVEFRPCEVQLTDFENAAFVVFVVLLTRVILTYQLNLVIPISKVDENLQNAQKRDAVREQKFWFRKDVRSRDLPSSATQLANGAMMIASGDHVSPDVELMSINEIINGKEGSFPGLIPLIHCYLSGIDIDADTHCTIQEYLRFIQRKASGELKTTARWMRDFIHNHPEYQQDSNVSEVINYDVLRLAEGITEGIIRIPEVVGDVKATKTAEIIPQAVAKAETHFLMNKEGSACFDQV